MPDMTAQPTADSPVINAPSGGYAQGVSNPPNDPIVANNDDQGSTSQQPAPQPAPQATPQATPQENSASGPNPAQDQAQSAQSQVPQPTAQPQKPASQTPQQQTPPIPKGVSPDNPNATHPAVQKAGLFHTIAEAMTGGPHYQTKIDANTGQVTQVKVPMSTARLGMALALEAISGGLTGMSQVGPGSAARGGAMAFNQAQQQQQQMRQQQNQQAKQQSDSYVKAATVAHLNSQTILQTAEAESRGIDTLQKLADNNKSLIDKQEAEGMLPEGRDPITQEEYMDGVKSGKYNGMEQLGAIAGYRLDSKGKPEATHVVIRKPFAMMPISQAEWNDYAVNHVKGFTVGTKIGDTLRIPAWQLGDAALQKSAFHLATLRNDEVSEALENSQDPAVKALAEKVPSLGKLLDDPTTGAGLRTALQKFAPYTSHSDIAHGGRDLYEDVQAMGASTPDPKNPGQYLPNPNAGYADQVAQAFGGMDVLKAYHEQVMPLQIKNENEARDMIASSTPGSRPYNYAQNWLNAVQKPITKETAPGIIASDQSTPERKAEANKVLGLVKNQTVSTAASVANAKAATKGAGGSGSGGSAIDYFEGDPTISATIKPSNIGPDGINHAFLDAFTAKNPQLGKLAEQIVHGQNLTGRYGLAKKDGQMLDAAVAAVSPEYDKNKAEQYNRTVTEYGPGGKMGKALINAGTAFDHLANLNDAVTAFTSGALPGFKTVGDWLQSDKSGSYATNAANAPQELGSLYANGGAAHEDDVKAYRDAYEGPPSKVRAAVKQQMINAMDKVEEVANAYYAAVPSTFVKPPTFLSDKAAASYTRVTKRPVDPRLMVHAHIIGQTQQTPNGIGVNNPAGGSVQGTKSTPPIGDIQNHAGFQYKFDGKNYVKQGTQQQ